MPINMAFFFYNTAAGKIGAFYPSPAGATESLLSLDAWDAIVEANPVLRTMQPDVEALLANRLGPHARLCRGRILFGPDRRLFRAGGIDSHPMARPIWRQRSLSASQPILCRSTALRWRGSRRNISGDRK